MIHSRPAILLLTLLIPVLAWAQVKSFSPQGMQESVNQVRVEFPTAKVGFGDLNAKAPAVSSCFQDFKGQGRWLGTQEWVFDFETYLPKGIDCAVRVGTETFSFNTGLPDMDISVGYSDEITEDQHFIIRLPKTIREKDLQAQSYIVISKLGDRIPVEMYSEKESQSLLKKIGRSDDVTEGYKRLLVKAKRPLPLGVKGAFIITKGLQYSPEKSFPNDISMEFEVRGPFAATMSCDHHSDLQKDCMPLGSIVLKFNRSIDSQYAEDIYLESDKGQKFYAYAKSEIDRKNKVSDLVFVGPFPALSTFKVVAPAKIKSIEGDVLEGLSKTLRTDELPPLLKFDSDFGVYESEGKVAIPLNVRNVELSLPTSVYGIKNKLDLAKLPQWLSFLKSSGSRSDVPEDLLLKNSSSFSEEFKIERKQAAKAIEVVGIPVEQKGLYLIKVSSKILNTYYAGSDASINQLYSTAKTEATEWTLALVTNMAVHFKESDEGFLVWVTELKTGKPISQAAVKIFGGKGELFFTAQTNSEGLATIKKSTLKQELNQDYTNNYGQFYAVAQAGDDFSITSNYWSRGLEPWRFGSNLYQNSQGALIHAILDRTLLKENETLSGKIISRYFDDQGLMISEKNEYPQTLVLNHISGLQKFEIPLKWNKQNGSTVFSWKIPVGVKNGQWTLVTNNKTISTIVVEDYRLPMIDLKLAAEKPQYVDVDSLNMNVYGQYFSGGVASNLKFKFRWSQDVDYAGIEGDYSEYDFFRTLENNQEVFGESEDSEAGESAKLTKASVVEGALDKNGKWSKKISLQKQGARPYKLNTEVEYRDPNGETKIAKKYIKVWPSDTLLGVKYGDIKRKGVKAFVEVKVVAIDPDGKPHANKAVEINLVKHFSYTHKKRLIGGFYGSDYYYEFKPQGKVCSGNTNTQGIYTCTAEISEAGELYLQASAKSSSGDKIDSATSIWIPSPEDFYLGDYSNSDRIDLIPDKKTYKVGDLAEFKLVMPFSEAQVLITVERDGITHHEIKKINSTNPVFKLPIKAEYVPNVYISVLAVRGRIGEFQKDHQVDLARPSVKFALTNIQVDPEQNLLKVQLSTPKKDYKARDEVKVKVKVSDYLGRPTPQAEVLLVGVDEGLLALKGNDTWDLASHLLKFWGLGVRTATNMVMLEGKRHFGLKAVPLGGDGAGGVLTRELFDSLLYWNPNLKVDKNGEVEVAIKLNDSTTSFRFVAVVLNGQKQFGTGKTSVRSSQDFIIMPGITNVARTGDKFQAGFTVRNTTSSPGNIHLTLTTDLVNQKLSPHVMSLKANEAKEVSWPIRVTEGISQITYTLEAKTQSGKLVDRVKKVQQIVPFSYPRIYQSTFAQASELKSVNVIQPTNLGAPTSEIIVDVAEKLGTSKEGLKTFWDAYGYTCFEQKFSRAVSLTDSQEWKTLARNISIYQDDEGLLKYFPKMTKGDVALTSYVLSMTHYLGWEIPVEAKDRMTSALTQFIEGRLSLKSGRADDQLQKISAIEALALQGIKNPGWIPNLKLDLEALPMFSLLQLFELTKQKDNLVGAGITKTRLIQKIRGTFYYTGTKVYLKNKDRENLFWMLRDENTTLLKFMQVFMNAPEFAQDLPKVFRGIIERQTNNSFPLTMNNAWLGLVNSQFEKKNATPVTGQFAGKLAAESKGHKWTNGKKGSLTFTLKSKKENLILQQQGTGNPWVTVSAKGLLAQTKNEFNGFTLKRTLKPLSQKTKGQWSVGDRIEVELEFTSKMQSNWVVVSEPTPTGASVLDVENSGIHEYRPEVSNFYFPWVYSGEKIKYTLILSQKGEYKLPGTLVEVMYSPDIFAKLVDTILVVK